LKVSAATTPKKARTIRPTMIFKRISKSLMPQPPAS